MRSCSKKFESFRFLYSGDLWRAIKTATKKLKIMKHLYTVEHFNSFSGKAEEEFIYFLKSIHKKKQFVS